MRVAVITDSTSYIPESTRQELDIHMIPLSVVFDSESFREEIDISTEDFYQKVRESEQLPKTSQPAIGEMTDKLTQLAAEYDQAIFITLSSGISGTYQSAVSAGAAMEDIEVVTFDSEISCLAQGFYVLEAARLAKQGQDIQAMVARLEQMKKSLRAYFMVDDLNNLHRGGRLNGAQAILGSMLQVKPILHFENTKIVPFEKIRTKKKAVKRMLDLFDEDARTGAVIEASVIHANRKDEAEALRQQLMEQYPHATITISYVGPVIGTHLGEGAIGLTWYQK
ncbi:MULTISPECIES: DegV family protein [Gracilibacillus]|uniref:DegV family protein n=1 Tax=Gracilibacillus TaxID=74385 RepID=UPI0008255DC8|nr:MULTISPECIES: DegV family protein [Gracilibacillus]